MSDPLNSKRDEVHLSNSPDTENRAPLKSSKANLFTFPVLVLGISATIWVTHLSNKRPDPALFFGLIGVAIMSIGWSVYKLFLTDNPITHSQDDISPPNAFYQRRPYYTELHHTNSSAVPPQTERTIEKQSPVPETDEYALSAHTQDAIRAANRAIDKSQPMVVDIGMLVYRSGEKPALYRALDIPNDADKIQPFVQLHVPLPLLDSGAGRVRFEILESGMNVVFSYEQLYTLKNGLNLITPAARLSVKDSDKTYVWELRVSLGNTLLAIHDFGWGNVNGDVMALGTDGEISDELQSLLDEEVSQPLSLDDLLAQKHDDVHQKQQNDR